MGSIFVGITWKCGNDAEEGWIWTSWYWGPKPDYTGFFVFSLLECSSFSFYKIRAVSVNLDQHSVLESLLIDQQFQLSSLGL